MKVKLKLAIVLLCALFCCAFTPRLTANAEDRATFSVRFKGEEIAVFDDVVPRAENHIIYEQMRDRRINAAPSVKREYLAELLKTTNPKDAVITCCPGLKKVFEATKKRVYVAPENSIIEFYPDRAIMFDVKRERNGAAIDEDAFYRDAANAIINRKGKIDVKLNPVPASVTAQANRRFLYLKSHFRTDLSSSSAARKHNVALALRSINGEVIESGETLSFNATVGERSEKRGYKGAKIIVGGEYVDGVGGGVCQASTTLYNAALIAGIKARARSHSLKPSYVLPSFDAMVNSSSSDLVLTNDTHGPIFIKARATENAAEVWIYGEKNAYEIRRRSKIREEGDLPADEIIEDEEGKYSGSEEDGGVRIVSGERASVSEGWLDYYRSGELVKSVKIRSDKYKAKRGKIAVKPKKVEFDSAA
jgi:hypothetical protein